MDISPEYTLEGLMLKLKLQYFGHLMRRVDSLKRPWRREEKGMTEDEMAGWHLRLNGHEFKQTPGVGDGQGSLACWRRRGHKELDMTEWLNWTELWFPSCDSAKIISFASQYLRSFVNRKHSGRWSFLLPHAPDHTTPARVPYWGKSCWFPKQQFCWYFFLLQNQIHLLKNNAPAGPILLRRQSHRLMGVCPVIFSHPYESRGALSSEISNPQQNFFTEALILLLRLFYWLTQASQHNLG